MREERGIWIRKEEIKLSFLVDIMIVYTEHPKESMKKLLELVTAMWDHKIKDHILKLILFLYTNLSLVFELFFNWELKLRKYY